MYEIRKSFTFDSSHSLPHLKEGHKCRNLHGHTYKTTFYFESNTLDKNSFIIDFNDTKPIKKYIDDVLDHHYLNEILPVATTSENICKFLFDKFKNDFKFLVAVSIEETPTSFAIYREKR